MRSIPLKFRLRVLILGVALLSIPFALVLPRLRPPPPPSEAERRAVRVVEKYLATKGAGKPDRIWANRLADGSWEVKVTRIMNPEPGGYRVTNTFRVDGQSRCDWVSIYAGGAY